MPTANAGGPVADPRVPEDAPHRDLPDAARSFRSAPSALAVGVRRKKNIAKNGALRRPCEPDRLPRRRRRTTVSRLRSLLRARLGACGEERRLRPQIERVGWHLCDRRRCRGYSMECSMECSMACSMACFIECSMECSMECCMECPMACSIECSMACSIECRG